MNLPQTLYGQLYLLACDRKRDPLPFLGQGLRAAMLTELFLDGYLHDQDGDVHQTHYTRPSDPLLCSLFDHVGFGDPHTWAWFAAADSDFTAQRVHERMLDKEWLCHQRYRRLGLVPATRVQPVDGPAVADLTEQVAGQLQSAMTGGPTDIRLLSLGLLGVLAELPAVADRLYPHQWQKLSVLVTLAPVAGLHQSVESSYSTSKKATARLLLFGGAGGGCGGCGGCGG